MQRSTFFVLNHPCISGMNPVESKYIILLRYYWFGAANILFMVLTQKILLHIKIC
jgi:hypothetical protein